MTTTLTGPQAATLLRVAGLTGDDLVPVLAATRVSSGWLLDARDGTEDPPRLGPFAVPLAGDLDERRLVTDPAYSAAAAVALHRGVGLRGWTAYLNGSWRVREAEAVQAVAIAAAAVGSPVVPGLDLATDDVPQNQPPSYGGPSQPAATATPGAPSPAAGPVSGGLGSVRILGTEFEGEIGASVIGNPKWAAGIDVVPHLTLTVVDQNYAMLNRGVWRGGTRVTWSDLTLRIDQVSMSSGGHGTGQAELGCVDDIVYALQNLRGPRSMSGVSVYTWLAAELRAVGVDPGRFLLCESTPTQPEITRDVPDAAGESGGGQEASAWTTIVRLAKEQGKRVFVSGRRLVFGSARFGMQWLAEGELRVGWDGVSAGERWWSMPEVERTSIANRSEVLRVTGVVPHNRAPWFRPGVPVRILATPGVGEALMMVSHVEHELVPGADGAHVTLIEPVDPPAQPPPQPQTAAVNAAPAGGGATPGGGGYSSAASQFVALALQQVGDRYVFGAEAAASDPNPRVFDCSELVEWACSRIGISPRMPDGSANQLAHCRKNGTVITAAAAIGINGALLFSPGHVAISLGNGKTVEAMNPSAGVRQGNANGRGWTAGARVPGLKY